MTTNEDLEFSKDGTTFECVEPVHFFKRYVEAECYDIYHGVKPDLPKFMKSVTKEMWRQFSKEFAYSFGKYPSESITDCVAFGYTRGFTAYFYKCLRYFACSPTESLREEIVKYYDAVFGKKDRYWDDGDLDALERYIGRLRCMEL